LSTNAQRQRSPLSARQVVMGDEDHASPSAMEALARREAEQRAARMKFFKNQELFTQPFRAEFRATNMAPPSDELISPREARALVGAQPYSTTESEAADEALLAHWTRH
jgi:hypothetical protein